MKIELSEFTMSGHDYFRVLVRRYFSRRWWLYGILAIGLVFYVVRTVLDPTLMKANPIYIAIPGLALLVPLFYLFFLWQYAGDTARKETFKNRKFVIDDEGVTIVVGTGNIDSIAWSEISGFQRTGGNLLLFLSKQQFVILPEKIIGEHMRDLMALVEEKTKKTK